MTKRVLATLPMVKAPSHTESKISGSPNWGGSKENLSGDWASLGYVVSRDSPLRDASLALAAHPLTSSHLLFFGVEWHCADRFWDRVCRRRGWEA